MRIIAGEFRSRKLRTLAGASVRPTPDRLREALFNVLAPEIEGAVFLDAYAGSGAVGFEALSRGADHVIFFERSAAAMTVIHENAAVLGVAGRITAIRGSAPSLYGRHPAGIVFVDPPYDLTRAYDQSLDALALTSCRLAIAQHPSRLLLTDERGALRKYRVLRQGDNSLSFYSRIAKNSDAQ